MTPTKDATGKLSLLETTWLVFQRVLLELVGPALVAVGFTWFSLGSNSSWTLKEALPIFSSTFVACGMLWGVILRSVKNVTDSKRHKALIAKQGELAESLEASAKAIAGYATGGDSFPMLVNAKVKDFAGVRKALVDFEFQIVGEYALHNVRMKVWNRDAVPEIRGQMEFERSYMPMGSMDPNVTYERPMEVVFIEGRTNRIDLSWRSRNGASFQRFEVKMVDGALQMATFVTRDEIEIYSANLQGYDCDENGRPIFDMSPSPVDEFPYFNR